MGYYPLPPFFFPQHQHTGRLEVSLWMMMALHHIRPPPPHPALLGLTNWIFSN